MAQQNLILSNHSAILYEDGSLNITSSKGIASILLEGHDAVRLLFFLLNHDAWLPMKSRERFLTLIEREHTEACCKHPPLHSLHEAYAVLLEEMDEFKQEVWKQIGARNSQEIVKELVQIAAMAMRTALDCGLLE